MPVGIKMALRPARRAEAADAARRKCGVAKAADAAARRLRAQ